MPRLADFGITRVANVTALDRLGVPVAIAFRPNAKSIAVSQGKGRTWAHAKASAIMEATELWHAENYRHPLHLGAAEALSTRHLLTDPARLPRPYGTPWNPKQKLLWAEGRELMTGRPILVPYEMVHAEYTHPSLPAQGVFPASTNGLASGNSMPEAICHAICEVVERDALSVWHALSEADQQATRLHLATLDDPECRRIAAIYGSAGLETGLWDVTSNTGLATIMCVIREPGIAGGHLGLGSGTHFDRSIACMRALTEAAQTRLNYISGAREDLDEAEYDEAGLAEKSAAFDALFAAPPAQSFAETPTVLHDQLDQDLDFALASLEAAGITQIATVDLSQEEHGIAVTRVVVPGLEAPHDDASYQPGPRAGGAS